KQQETAFDDFLVGFEVFHAALRCCLESGWSARVTVAAALADRDVPILELASPPGRRFAVEERLAVQPAAHAAGRLEINGCQEAQRLAAGQEEKRSGFHGDCRRRTVAASSNAWRNSARKRCWRRARSMKR